MKARLSKCSGTPAAVDDVTTNEDASVAVHVLDNDFGAGLSVIATETPAHETFVVNADQTITYAPAANYSGTDRLKH
jgi:hypothetical protein